MLCYSRGPLGISDFILIPLCFASDPRIVSLSLPYIPLWPCLFVFCFVLVFFEKIILFCRQHLPTGLPQGNAPAHLTKAGISQNQDAKWTPPSSPLVRIKSSFVGKSTHWLQRAFHGVFRPLPALPPQGFLDVLSKSHDLLWVSPFSFYTPPLRLLVSGFLFCAS